MQCSNFGYAKMGHIQPMEAKIKENNASMDQTIRKVMNYLPDILLFFVVGTIGCAIFSVIFKQWG